MKEIINEVRADFKDFFELPSDKKERKEFIKALFGGLMVMACCYILIWAVYIFAPNGYWPW